MYEKKYTPKYSYSRLNTYDSCGWKYKLTYEDGHYIFSENAANLFGTLVHWVEEQIAHCIQTGREIPYEQLKNDFINLEIPKTSPKDMKGGIYGINYIKQKYPEDFFKTNDLGQSYSTKTDYYLKTGIYRLENYMKANPGYEIYGMEQYFQIDYNGYILSGNIDRIIHDTINDKYIIEDIKTKDKPFKDSDMETPLQFLIYTKALKEMLDIDIEKISCIYDLPFCDLKQGVTNPKFLKDGIKKLDKIFNGISGKEFVPNPSPLCAYCPFSETNAEQPEDGKHLCCYYSLWTQGGKHKVWEVAHKWEGLARHAEILAEFYADKEDFEFDF